MKEMKVVIKLENKTDPVDGSSYTTGVAEVSFRGRKFFIDHDGHMGYGVWDGTIPGLNYHLICVALNKQYVKVKTPTLDKKIFRTIDDAKDFDSESFFSVLIENNDKGIFFKIPEIEFSLSQKEIEELFDTTSEDFDVGNIDYDDLISSCIEYFIEELNIQIVFENK